MAGDSTHHSKLINLLLSLPSPPSQVEAFHLSFLPKLLDVKDNIKKQPLLHHLVAMVMEKFPDSTDLHSELGAVHRVAKVTCLFICLSVHMSTLVAVGLSISAV